MPSYMEIMIHMWLYMRYISMNKIMLDDVKSIQLIRTLQEKKISFALLLSIFPKAFSFLSTMLRYIYIYSLIHLIMEIVEETEYFSFL